MPDAIGQTRFGDFVWEVLLQAKGHQGATVAGYRARLVFWGFLAFALVTLNHFAIGFGCGFFRQQASLDSFYFALRRRFCGRRVLSRWSGLAIRRFIVQPNGWERCRSNRASSPC